MKAVPSGVYLPGKPFFRIEARSSSRRHHLTLPLNSTIPNMFPSMSLQYATCPIPGRTILGTTISPPVDSIRSGLSAAVGTSILSIKGYHPGDLIAAHYNPESPVISTLTPGPAWSIYGRLGFAFTLVVGGLFGFSLPSKNPA